MAYSDEGDLLIGDTRIDGIVDKQKMIASAADEIDGMIGHIYKTPIVVSDPDGIGRPTKLLLKTINNHLATGRIILTITEPDEKNNLNALGKYYVNLALSALQQVVDRQIVLPNVELITSPDGNSANIGPRIVNGDPGSLVDLFYERTNPANRRLCEPFFGFYPPRTGSTL